MDLAQATGAIESIDLAGQSYPIRALTLNEWGKLQAWLKKHHPSPVTRAAEAIKQARDAGAPLDQATQDDLLDHAQRAALTWPPRVGTRSWLDAIESAEGGLEHLLHAVLSAADPAATPERAELLARAVPVEGWIELISLALHGRPSAPKAAPAARPAAA